MIYKPYALLPSDLEDGASVIDISGSTTFFFQVSGTSPIKTVTIEMGDLNGSSTNAITIDHSSDPIYYTGIDGKAKVIEETLSSSQVKSIVGTSNEQRWRVTVVDLTDVSVSSDWVFAVLKTKPCATLTTNISVNTKSNTWTLNYTPSVTYENKLATNTKTSIRSVHWTIYDKASPSSPLYDTGLVYGCVNPSYTVDGLMSGHVYFARAIVVDQDGVAATAISDDVVVSYDHGASGIMELVYTDELDDVSPELAYGHEIALDITNFSGESGVSSGGQGGYEIVNLGLPTGYVLRNKTGNTIVWNDIHGTDSDDITVRFRFTPVPYRNGENILSIYIDDECTTRVRYAITTADGVGTLYPEDDLFPSDDLFPNVGSYQITAFFEYRVDDQWYICSSTSTDVDINNLGTDDLVYYEHTFTYGDIFYPDYNIYIDKPRINGVELVGDLSLTDIHVDVIEPMSFSEIDNALEWW